MITAAVLTISDTASAGTRADRSGPAVRARLEQLGWNVSVTEVIPDEAAQIGARLSTLADGGQVSAIFTTGGTGVAPRDVTPEALSRSLAGTRGKVLIVSLPGSPRGAVQSLDAIVELVPHVLDLLRGRTDHGAASQD